MYVDSYQGHLLVASPHLLDSNFSRTVILLLQHDHQGALGIVLNRPSENKLQDIWQEISEYPCEVDQPLYFGGPLRGPLIALHTQSDLSQDQAAPGTFYSMKRDNLCKLVEGENIPFRFYSGYAGWSGGQLEDELKTGSWLVTEANDDFIFCDTDEDLWKIVVKTISDDILFSSLKINHIPDDPTLN